MWLYEVEFRNHIWAALRWCAQVVAHLEGQGITRLPKVVVVANAAREVSFTPYVNEAPLPASGFTALCDFRSFAEVYSDALRLLPQLPEYERAA